MILEIGRKYYQKLMNEDNQKEGMDSKQNWRLTLQRLKLISET